MNCIEDADAWVGTREKVLINDHSESFHEAKVYQTLVWRNGETCRPIVLEVQVVCNFSREPDQRQGF